ncbi:DUF960 family protein [Intestinibacter sp.]
MFEKENRYMTSKIAEELPIDVNILLWSLIDELSVEKDYLQVFELDPLGNDVVKIIHKQEVPKYENTIYIHNESIKQNKKIYAIDSIEYSTLLFSDEY